LAFAADSGAFPALGGEHVMVADDGVAPPQIRLEFAASTVWFGWLLIVKVRSGPNWASIGLAQDALVGVRQSSPLLRVA